MSRFTIDPPPPDDGCERCGYESRFRICTSCAEQDEIERADSVDVEEMDYAAE